MVTYHTETNSHSSTPTVTYHTETTSNTSTPTVSYHTETTSHTSTPTVTYHTETTSHSSTPTVTYHTENTTHSSTPTVTYHTETTSHTSTPTVTYHTETTSHSSTPTVTYHTETTTHSSTPIVTYHTETTSHTSTPTVTYHTETTSHSSTPTVTYHTETTSHSFTPGSSGHSSIPPFSLSGTTIQSSTASLTESFTKSSRIPSTTAVTTSQISVACQNGGTPNGNGCSCPVNFYGTLCQFLKDVIIVENIQVSIQVTVEVTNENFTPSLNDPFSPAYKIFSIRFSEQMQLVYGSIAGYQGVEIISLSPGSIIVNHKVLIEMPLSKSGNSNDLNAVYAQLNQSIQQKNCTSISSDKLCFNQTATNISHEAIPNTVGACLTSNVPAAYRQYYFLMNVSSALTCVSNCSNTSANHYNCNKGRCLVISQGPTCFCEFSDLYWYNGDRCQVVINKRGVYGGVAVGLAVLLIIIVILAVFVYKYKNKKHSHQVADLEERWYEQGWESNVPQGFTVRNPQTMTWEGSESGGSSSSKEYFRPSLDKVDTSVQLQLGRPQVTTL
ncbi:mucin-3B-like [Rhinatrema bivittatum]|uniref:mucin-3B-like n=1 Tax=Rhinatrema bivittatum TaxID=194408 RepID=UPI0011269704|nr:mucin-3B-like [Rhinatrema bivittatum]